MSIYNWNEQTIKESSLNSFGKKLLLNEFHKVKDNYEIKGLYAGYLNHLKTRKDFKDCILTKIFEDLIKTFEQSKNLSINFPTSGITDYGLLSFSCQFYKFLNDPVLTKTFEEFLAKDYDHIRIQKINGQPATASVKGNCISSKQTKESFLSFYYEDALNDYIEFIHETGHVVANKSIKNNNPLFNGGLLTEFEAYYLQLLACRFIGYTYKDKDYEDILTYHALLGIYHAEKSLLIKDIITRHLIIPSEKQVNKELKSLGFNEICDSKKHLKTSTLDLYTIANSILAAYDLIKKYESDLEKGLSEYKRLLSSNEEDFLRLYSEFGITYHEDGFKNVTKTIKKINSL